MTRAYMHEALDIGTLLIKRTCFALLTSMRPSMLEHSSITAFPPNITAHISSKHPQTQDTMTFATKTTPPRPTVPAPAVIPSYGNAPPPYVGSPSPPAASRSAAPRPAATTPVYYAWDPFYVWERLEIE